LRPKVQQNYEARLLTCHMPVIDLKEQAVGSKTKPEPTAHHLLQKKRVSTSALG
jgi:hypothetical protein